MTDSRSDENWVKHWLEQQRAALERAASATPASAGAGPKDPWRTAADKYLEALKSSGQSSAASDASFQPFAIGEELLQVWRNAWDAADTTRKAAATSFTDLLQRLPTLGMASEQTQLLRGLAAAQNECHVLEQELRKVLLELHADALDLLEKRLREGGDTGTSIKTFRDLYNLWVECAEQIYSRLAHSDAFAKLQADLGNATLKLRARQQKLVEHALKQLDLPTRSELNSVHLQLRELKRKVAQLERPAPPAKSTRTKAKSSTAKPKGSRR
jgi:class III poly(R)-hydroxyalkanoic acid synthase PhaE subunit